MIQDQGLIFNFSTQGGSASGGHFSIFKQKIIFKRKRIKNEN